MKNNKLFHLIIVILFITLSFQYSRIQSLKSELSINQQNIDQEFVTALHEMMSWFKYDYNDSDYSHIDIERLHSIGYASAKRATLLLDNTTFLEQNSILGPVVNNLYYYISEHPPLLVDIDYEFNSNIYSILLSLSNDLSNKEIAKSIYEYIIHYND